VQGVECYTRGEGAAAAHLGRKEGGGEGEVDTGQCRGLNAVLGGRVQLLHI
jgi:hypothetical protein